VIEAGIPLKECANTHGRPFYTRCEPAYPVCYFKQKTTNFRWDKYLCAPVEYTSFSWWLIFPFGIKIWQKLFFF